MAKVLADAEIQTRTARRRLARGTYWRAIDNGVHLGYRRANAGGLWLVRWRHGAGYRRENVGEADDELAVGSLDYDAAVRAARAAVRLVRKSMKVEEAGPVATVALAVEDYVAARDARDSRRAGRPIRSDARQRLARYVIGREVSGGRAAVKPAPLAKIALHELKERDLLNWRDALPDSLKLTSRQRLFNDLKAALNAAYIARRDILPPELPVTIKHGLRAIDDDYEAEPVARENQILSDSEVASLVASARAVDVQQEFGGDLHRLVLLLAATGARFSQVVRMRVGDVQADKGRLMMPVSRKGKGNKNYSNPVPVGADVLDALAPVVADRASDAILLERWRAVQVKGGGWEPAKRGPWQSPSELRRPWEMIRVAAGLPDAIPYALRHSSIVRGIRANLPIRLVAAIHDTSTAMIERHYAKWIATGLEDMARAAIVRLDSGDA